MPGLKPPSDLKQPANAGGSKSGLKPLSVLRPPKGSSLSSPAPPAVTSVAPARSVSTAAAGQAIPDGAPSELPVVVGREAGRKRLTSRAKRASINWFSNANNAWTPLQEVTKAAKDELDESIAVVVRVKPYLPDEPSSGIWRPVVSLSGDVLGLDAGGQTKGSFAFDRVFRQDSSQARLYSEAVRPIVAQVIKGYNGTVLAYGQTGSGKTYTIQGELDQVKLQGIIPRAVYHLFHGKERKEEGDNRAEDHKEEEEEEEEVSVTVSYLELYNENVRDLLVDNEGRNLEVHEDKDGSFYVPSLRRVPVKSSEECMDHAILTVNVERKVVLEQGRLRVTRSKLNIVDLAGSEKYQQDSSVKGKESVAINQSLSCLANVIAALTRGVVAHHVPYRESNLTRLLKDSLGGNCKTLFISNLHPSFKCARESLATLRYASRAKRIKNKAQVNSDDDKMTRALQEELQFTKALCHRKDQFIRHVLSLVHTLADATEKEGDEDQEYIAETAVAHLYMLGREARIGTMPIERYRSDLSAIQLEIDKERAERRRKEALERGKLKGEQEKEALEKEKEAMRARNEEMQAELALAKKDGDDEILLSGPLLKKSDGLIKRWQRRWVQLTPKRLLYFKSFKTKKDQMHFVAIDLRDLEASLSKEGDTVNLQIATDDRIYFFAESKAVSSSSPSSATSSSITFPATAASLSEWCDTIQKAAADVHERDEKRSLLRLLSKE